MIPQRQCIRTRCHASASKRTINSLVMHPLPGFPVTRFRHPSNHGEITYMMTTSDARWHHMLPHSYLVFGKGARGGCKQASKCHSVDAQKTNHRAISTLERNGATVSSRNTRCRRVVGHFTLYTLQTTLSNVPSKEPEKDAPLKQRRHQYNARQHK